MAKLVSQFDVRLKNSRYRTIIEYRRSYNRALKDDLAIHRLVELLYNAPM